MIGVLAAAFPDVALGVVVYLAMMAGSAALIAAAEGVAQLAGKLLGRIRR